MGKRTITVLLTALFTLAVFANGKPDSGSGTPKFITVGTGATGGAFYPIGVAVASVITNNLDIDATAQVTGGALENIELVQNKTIDLGITMGNSAQEAYEKNGYTNINALFGGLSKGFFQIVVMNDSPIKTMRDLIGRKVCMGPAGNGAISVAETIWGAYGFSITDVKATYLSYDDGIRQLTDGNCDAVVVQAAIPSAAIQELAASSKAYRLIPVDENVAKTLSDKYQYFGYGKLPKAIYQNNPSDTMTMYIINMMIVRADLPEDTVYNITKSLFENIETIKASHKAASGITLKDAARTSVPLHPGAQKYFNEVKVK
ncbi:TAXI family TRAP transporter solute-binding subunit [Treponema parvum]|uniref:TAXI family TRAP transporter solute-binding subunit n=1 Tax=Treponema parvum TaxID=138851 RepID=A0A975ID37_9SPIR|nr:TAXI family TRAP transporter solute-binding subunit [Treponema parvum]QTQ12555.1 TAXI family TRAP transporter solute-binding subunit [Treponema parvum]